MIEPTHVVGYGRPASLALAASIADAQSADPLAPVTVVVSSNFVGLSVRRLLGAGVLGGEQGGIANVDFVTPFQLAEAVAADLLLDQRPITNPVLGAAVRQTLADDPGPYAPVAEHEATEAALAGLFAELSNVDEAGLESIEDEGSVAALSAIRLHRSIAARLHGFHTEHDLATAAATRVDLATRLEPFGHVIWFLPAPMSPALGQFLGSTLRDAASSAVIVGLCGAEGADESVWRTCQAAGVHRPSSVAAVGVSGADSIVSVTDAPEEVREVCRSIISLVERGVRLDRIGVFYPAPDPYVRIIRQQFDAAGIVSNGPDRRRLAESVAGRLLLGALELPSLRWRRDRVMAVVSSGPIRLGESSARPSTWDQLSRDAGVVGDISDWRAKLQLLTTNLQERIAARAAVPEGHDRLAGDLHDLGALIDFIESLAGLLTNVDNATTWADKASASAELLSGLLGREHQHQSWPESEQVSFERVEDALQRLSALDPIEPSPSTAVFVRALRSELDVARGRFGRFGSGVVFGPVASAVGLDLDAVFLVGASEGLMPIPRRDDGILPEAVRLCSLDQLELKSTRLHHQHRAVLAALAAAPSGARTFTYARGDLRSGRRTLPSRWLLQSASAISGHVVHATDFDSLPDDVVVGVGSFASGIRRQGTAGTVTERDLVALGRAVEGGLPAESHELSRLVGNGLAMQAARASADFTEFDGNLGRLAGAGLPTIDERPVSPSQLETWASCGLKYFLRSVLKVSDRDDPERTDDISALDRGSIIHTILEKFVAEVIEQGPPAPSQSWSDENRRRLHEIADIECASYEATGRTGRAVRWRVRRDELTDVLDQFLSLDNVFRQTHGATPTAVELDMGVKTGKPVRVRLRSGSVVVLRGIADRVDTTTDGSVIVSDYKSGKGTKFKTINADPFIAGTGLQLGMYAEGAMAATGAHDAAAHYWLVERPEAPRKGYVWTADLRERFDELLEGIATGIADGVFAASPGDWNSWRQTNEECKYCEFDSVCVRNRGDQAEAKRSAPALRVRDVLDPPDDADGDES